MIEALGGAGACWARRPPAEELSRRQGELAQMRAARMAQTPDSLTA